MIDAEERSSLSSGHEFTHRCEVDAADLDAFVACIALGTLEAMKSCSWPLQSGIWTLARPAFWQNLENAGLHNDILDVLQRADELSAIESLTGRPAAEAELERMIAVVRTCLAAKASNAWRATWVAHEQSHPGEEAL